MAYCVTGPAIGPAGRGHTHRVSCTSSAPLQPGVSAHTHALGACCPPCAAGQPCESQGLGAVPIGNWALLGVAAIVAYMVLGGSSRRTNPDRQWYVYSKEPGAKRAEFVHGPYTEGRARAQLTRERTMGLSATMRRKR